jgi:DNA-binding MarR family transcriptional regulator
MVNPNGTNDVQLLVQFSQMFRTLVDTFVERVDIHRGQALLLCTIVRQDGMTQSEIADLLSVQGATVTNMLQRMEESGWVIRRRDPDDNRLVRVYATDTGRTKEQDITTALEHLQEKLFEGIPEAQRSVIRQLLQQMMTNIESADRSSGSCE